MKKFFILKVVIIISIISIIAILIVLNFSTEVVENVENETVIEPEEEISEEQMRQTAITLYFEDKQSLELVSEEKKVDAKDLIDNPWKTLKEEHPEGSIVKGTIKNITDFTSSIWQVHPFREGNTRTTAVFIEKYLISLGYNVDNSLFKDKSVYFRNALVRSNYFNNYLNIKEDKSYLIKFYENLLLGKNNNLHSEDLIVKELF